MDSSWSPDVCVHCEQPTSGGAYCSQSCRLANLDSSSCTSSHASSPLTSAAANRPSPNSTNPHSKEMGLQLQPAIDFSSYKFSSAPTATTRGVAMRQPSYFSSPFPGNANSSRFAVPPRVLTPSTSRSSLSSVSSNSSYCSGLSDRTRNELRDYSNSFDLIRNWKRRMTSNYP